MLLARLCLVNQGEHVTQRRFAPGQFRFPARRLGIGGGAHLRRAASQRHLIQQGPGDPPCMRNRRRGQVRSAPDAG